MPMPSGNAIPPAMPWIVANGQVAASGIAWPWGKTAALGDVVSRQ